MTDTSVVDASGITRTPTGEINNPVAPQGTTGQPPDPKPNTTPTPPKEGETEPKTVLNKEGTEPKPPEGEKKEGDPKTGAPEKYADFKLPEGFTMSEEVKKEVNEVFKGMNLTQEQAQGLVDLNAKLNKSAAEAASKSFADTTAAWLKDSEAHPDLKGKLGVGQEVNVRIGRFLIQLNDPKLASDFRALMDLTGAGNHQAFIRVIDYAAQKLTEGKHVGGNGPSPAGQSRGPQPAPTAAQAMWPTLPTRAQ